MRTLALILICLSIVACGQKGPLYLEEDTEVSVDASAPETDADGTATEEDEEDGSGTPEEEDEPGASR